MAVNKTINKRTNTHGAMRNCIEYVLRQDNLPKTFHLDISKKDLENKFDGNRQKTRDSANRDNRSATEHRNYYRELDYFLISCRAIY